MGERKTKKRRNSERYSTLLHARCVFNGLLCTWFSMKGRGGKGRYDLLWWMVLMMVEMVIRGKGCQVVQGEVNWSQRTEIVECS